MHRKTKWRNVAFDWNQARAFLAAAEEGSLSAAARALGQTQPTLSRQVSALEEQLGVMLFERAGRSVALTRAGVELLDHAQTMAAAADRMTLAASGQSQTIDGLVRITASDLMSAYVLPPAIAQLRSIAPLLEIDVVADNNVRDLLRREADVAVRHARPSQPDLVAKLLREETARFYATTSYLETHGEPRLHGDLTNHQFVSFAGSGRMLEHLRSAGLRLTEANVRLGSSAGVVAWEMARAGLGVAVMSDEIAAKFDEFQPVLTEVAPFAFPTWLVTHRELNTSRRIRLVFDHLAAFLSG